MAPDGRLRIVLRLIDGLKLPAQRVGAARVGLDLHAGKEVLQGRVAKVFGDLRAIVCETSKRESDTSALLQMLCRLPYFSLASAFYNIRKVIFRGH
jgi:hypothetical protein